MAEAGPSTPRKGSSREQSKSAASIPTAPGSASGTMEINEEELDAPTSSSSAAAAGRTRAGTTGNGGGGEEDSDGEEEAPDYLRLLSMTNKSSKTSSSSPGDTTVIPKRGEKDFEPTGFGGQAKLLERSREAMYQAVSGERKIGSRSLVRATWLPGAGRAVVHDLQGKIFETIGIVTRTTKTEVDAQGNPKTTTVARNELMPEEALFLMERGSLQIYSLPISHHDDEQEWDGRFDVTSQAPMSLQQAFAMLMDKNGLSREKYLLYAYLKRLGYVVQRASIVDAARAAPISASALAKKNNNKNKKTTTEDFDTTGIIADPQRPIRLVKIWDLLFYIPRRMAQLAGDGWSILARWISALVAKLGAAISRLVNAIVSRTTGKGGGSISAKMGLGSNRGLLGNQKWESYESVFTSLQIVPSGHDFFLPKRGSESSSVTNTSSSAAPNKGSNASLEPFYYAWRPATTYRKSHPPPPEFRIVVVDAKHQAPPSIWEFEHIFSSVPIPGSDEELFGTTTIDMSQSQDPTSDTASQTTMMDEEERQRRLAYEKETKAKNDQKNRAAYGKFSDGKRKFLAEKAEIRKAEFQTRQANREAKLPAWKQTFSKLWKTWIGLKLWKVLMMEFRVVRMLARLFRHAPPGCYVASKRQPKTGAGGGSGGRGAALQKRDNRPVNVFPPLKAGRRSVVLAVVDGSITTLLRFGEAEFAKWKLYGTHDQVTDKVAS